MVRAAWPVAGQVAGVLGRVLGQVPGDLPGDSGPVGSSVRCPARTIRTSTCLPPHQPTRSSCSSTAGARTSTAGTAARTAASEGVQTAMKLAEELTAHDAFAAHVDAEIGHRPGPADQPVARGDLVGDRVHRGSVLPIAAILLPPAGIRVAVTFVVVLLALARRVC